MRTLDALHWDVLRLHDDMLPRCGYARPSTAARTRVGVDTWGVDFALLGRGGYCWATRAATATRTPKASWNGVRPDAAPELFRRTGIQFMRFNSLFQLLALRHDHSPLLEAAETLLFMPDLFHYFFTGEKVNEYTDASTSQMLDPATRTWSAGLLKEFDLPERIQGKIVPPCTVLGPLLRTVAEETGLRARG